MKRRALFPLALGTLVLGAIAWVSSVAPSTTSTTAGMESKSTSSTSPSASVKGEAASRSDDSTEPLRGDPSSVVRKAEEPADYPGESTESFATLEDHSEALIALANEMDQCTADLLEHCESGGDLRELSPMIEVCKAIGTRNEEVVEAPLEEEPSALELMGLIPVTVRLRLIQSGTTSRQASIRRCFDRRIAAEGTP